nr:PREDICTED: uncharacterized protein LOC108194921 [Daucus carota subsp. sativus]
MPFNKYDMLSSLNDCTDEWLIRVKAHTVWRVVNRKTGEFKGLNIVFFDDSSERIHAYISPEIGKDLKEELKEGQIYNVQNFKVKFYNGDEPQRAIRNEKHIYFSADTIIEKYDGPGLKIPDHSFDLFPLSSMIGMLTDNRFLTDVIGVITSVQDRAVYMKDEVEKSHVLFTITDGKTSMNVTFFNEFGDDFLYERARALIDPEIIVITSAKVSVYKGNIFKLCQ